MTPASILRRNYTVYDSGDQRRNPLFSLHRKIIQSSAITRILFGISVDRVFLWKNNFFDLTTVLLKSDIRARLRKFSDPKLLEIGVGG